MLYEPAKKYNLDLVIMNNYRIIPYINYKWKISSNISADKYNVPIYSPELFEDYFINFLDVIYLRQIHIGGNYINLVLSKNQTLSTL